MRDLIRRIFGRTCCPDCPHDMSIHGRYGCLGAVYNRLGGHERWCDCTHTSGAARQLKTQATTGGES